MQWKFLVCNADEIDDVEKDQMIQDINDENDDVQLHTQQLVKFELDDGDDIVVNHIAKTLQIDEIDIIVDDDDEVDDDDDIGDIVLVD